MPFDMPVHRPISNTKSIRQRPTNMFESQHNMQSATSIGKMCPDKNTLPQTVLDAYRRQDGEKY